MTTDDLKSYYINSYQFRERTGMSHASFLNWMKDGFVPIRSQYIIEEITEGELKADWKHAK